MRKRRGWSAVLCGAILLLTGTGIDPFQNLYRDNRAGIKALGEDQTDEALEAFSDAQALAPDDPRVLYNLGLALARKGQLTEADQAWKRASELAEGKLQRDAWFNRGVAALSAKDPARAARAFGESLLVDPQDEEARRNLEFALRQLQRKKQDSQQNQPSDSKRKQDSKEQGKPSSSQQGQSGKQQQQQSRQQGEKNDDPSQAQRGTSKEQRQQQSPSPGKKKEEDRQQQERKEEAGASSEKPSQGGDERQKAGRQEGSPQSEAPSRAESSDKQMAARLLKMLEQNETQALRRALRRREKSPRHPREKSW